MARPYTPRAAYVVWAVGLVLCLLAGLAVVTGQPVGVSNLAVGVAMGLFLGSLAMLGEVRRLHRR